jgi:hypothetical protein
MNIFIHCTFKIDFSMITLEAKIFTIQQEDGKNLCFGKTSSLQLNFDCRREEPYKLVLNISIYLS